MKKKLIGFAGAAGAGKSAAGLLTQNLFTETGIPAAVYNFAAPLKAATRIMFLLPDKALYGTKEEKEAIDPFWQISGREAMQYVGTELFRNKVMQEVHNKRMVMQLKQSRAEVNIIDDVRFQNEVGLIEELGGTVYGILPENSPEKKTTSPRRTTKQWSAFYDMRYARPFVDFIERLSSGIIHSSEEPALVKPDNMISNDHALGMGYLKDQLAGQLF